MKAILKDSMTKLDFSIWIIVLMFFIFSSLIMWWNIVNSFLWASAIIVLMFLIWFSIELILWALKNVKWLWKITGFITNWPEALVLIVWLLAWDVLFAASTPLWSNFMNPILLLIWLVITWFILRLSSFKYKNFFIFWFILTAILAVSFFFIPEKYYIYWILASLIWSVYLFMKKYDSEENTEKEEENESKLYLPLWFIILLFSWYFLDPIVSFTAENSLAPKWLIWFLVLATLTSWPEFKSVIALLKRKRILDAFINILISNITNLWLAIIWVMIWLVIK